MERSIKISKKRPRQKCQGSYCFALKGVPVLQTTGRLGRLRKTQLFILKQFLIKKFSGNSCNYPQTAPELLISMRYKIHDAHYLWITKLACSKTQSAVPPWTEGMDWLSAVQRMLKCLSYSPYLIRQMSPTSNW